MLARPFLILDIHKVPTCSKYVEQLHVVDAEGIAMN